MLNRATSHLIAVLMCTSLLFSCNEPPVPKPKGYFRIDLPEHRYRQGEFDDCPFTFEVPLYSKIMPDTNRLSEPCWWYLVFPDFNCEVYLSYKLVEKDLFKLIEDAHTLAYSHAVKANEINQRKINVGKSGGLMFEIGGNAASPLQFYLTDSLHHFIRGSLYFNALPNADSVAPVVHFVKADIERMIQTVVWKHAARAS
ncbi:MAG: gliding motility lipoprotein GldD [Bacteroidia bacterium]|nr:gliding motility lipoprotein GldD [Bacteroidia bacterium]MCZ2278015.1 gliding motility lipoprotein GldD [Bacteroidia bacterium]